MLVGVPKETFPDERRVALVPASIPPLQKAGLDITVEAGAGEEAGYVDEAYREKGATIAPDRAAVFRDADIVVQINSYGANPATGAEDLDHLRRDQVLIGSADPLGAPERTKELAARGVTAFGMELMPRITRAQSMDVLSSQATIGGYKAVILAANYLPRLFPLFMTAAGTVKPARVFVIGAGVAGLQAIATAKRLGAVIQAFDVRPAVREQVESVGAKFLEVELEASGAEDKGGYATEQGEEFLRKQRELMAKAVSESDVVITTAAIPGKKAPVLVTADAVSHMDPGSVIVDLAAERGGNCELTRAGETIVEHGVTIVGTGNLPSSVPFHASQMYAKNVETFLLHLVRDGKLDLDMNDEITRGTLMCEGEEIVHPKLRELLELAPLEEPEPPEAPSAPASAGKES